MEVRVGARGQSGSCFSWDVANLVAVQTQEMSRMLLLLLSLLFPIFRLPAIREHNSSIALPSECPIAWDLHSPLNHV